MCVSVECIMCTVSLYLYQDLFLWPWMMEQDHHGRRHHAVCRCMCVCAYGTWLPCGGKRANRRLVEKDSVEKSSVEFGSVSVKR